MSNATPPDTLADGLHALGDVPPDRVLWNPRPGTATEADVLRCRRGTELVDGCLILKTVGEAKTKLRLGIGQALFHFIRRDRLGYHTPPAGLHRINSEVVRRPDAAFTRWPRVLDGAGTIPVVVTASPDLVIDILTATNPPAEQARKFREYFSAGTAVIWEIDPDTNTVTVHRPESQRVLTTADTLDGGAVLPDFALPLADLFNEPQLNLRPSQP